MTGFASAEGTLGDARLTLEVRSLNHRYLELRVRLPTELADHTFAIEQLARKRLERGRFDVSARLEGRSSSSRLAFDRLRDLHARLSQLRDEIAPGSTIALGDLVHLPEVQTGDVGVAPEQARAVLKATFEAALQSLAEMRSREGAALKATLTGHLAEARKLRAEVLLRKDDVLAQAHERLKDRVARLLGDHVEVDAGRLEQEVALLADRSDIAEELQRLESHFDQFAAFLEAEGPVGRRLDFLLQEITRETNTIGSKSQDAPLAHLVVALKAETERMREQVQNVE